MPEEQGLVFAFLICGKEHETWPMFVAHRVMRIFTHSQVVHVAVAQAHRDAQGRVCVGKTAFSTSPIKAPFQVVPIEECTEQGYDYIFAPTPHIEHGIKLLHALVGKPYTRPRSAYSILCRPTQSKAWVDAHTHPCNCVCEQVQTLSCSQAAAIVCLECGILDRCVQPEYCAPHELYGLLKDKYGLTEKVFIESQT